MGKQLVHTKLQPKQVVVFIHTNQNITHYHESKNTLSYVSPGNRNTAHHIRQLNDQMKLTYLYLCGLKQSRKFYTLKKPYMTGIFCVMQCNMHASIDYFILNVTNIKFLL